MELKSKAIKNEIRQLGILAALAIFFLFFTIWALSIPPSSKPIKCHDPSINYPVMDGCSECNLVFVAIGFLFILVVTLLLGKKWGDGFVYNCLVALRPVLIFFIGFCVTLAVVQIMGKAFGVLAPNFLAACNPNNYNQTLIFCALNPDSYADIVCMNSLSPLARYAFPSIITTMQAFDMCFFALYLNYRLNTAGNQILRYFKYTLQAIAFLCAVISGAVTSARNETGDGGLWVGWIFGIGTAIITIQIIKWFEKEREELPRFWNDPPPHSMNEIPPSPVPFQQLDSLPVSKDTKPQKDDKSKPPPYDSLSIFGLTPAPEPVVPAEQMTSITLV